ncbi:hypothetical protein HYFRA_00010214 [Hymenoscyphus fraxineus]|uniref:Uncharacterized protein n=1 Tax=Hymenoscyphus fraxineus TaxID=746836 RepID=A0A9N9PHS8_9HELO|nr:hypothetical protein HYFRA_00010214 [Hymenoscyphus fraxineus]
MSDKNQPSTSTSQTHQKTSTSGPSSQAPTGQPSKPKSAGEIAWERSEASKATKTYNPKDYEKALEADDDETVAGLEKGKEFWYQRNDNDGPYEASRKG